MTKTETAKLKEIARLATKYMRAYNDNIIQLEQQGVTVNSPSKEHILYYHRGYRDCYDGLLARLRSDNLIS
jgi:hypothetical protein